MSMKTLLCSLLCFITWHSSAQQFIYVNGDSSQFDAVLTDYSTRFDYRKLTPIQSDIHVSNHDSLGVNYWFINGSFSTEGDIYLTHKEKEDGTLIDRYIYMGEVNVVLKELVSVNGAITEKYTYEIPYKMIQRNVYYSYSSEFDEMFSVDTLLYHKIPSFYLTEAEHRVEKNDRTFIYTLDGQVDILENAQLTARLTHLWDREFEWTNYNASGKAIRTSNLHVDSLGQVQILRTYHPNKLEKLGHKTIKAVKFYEHESTMDSILWWKKKGIEYVERIHYVDGALQSASVTWNADGESHYTNRYFDLPAKGFHQDIKNERITLIHEPSGKRVENLNYVRVSRNPLTLRLIRNDSAMLVNEHFDSLTPPNFYGLNRGADDSSFMVLLDRDVAVIRTDGSFLIPPDSVPYRFKLRYCKDSLYYAPKDNSQEVILYGQDGLRIAPHPITFLDPYSEKTTIGNLQASDGNKFGVYNIRSKKWVIAPEYVRATTMNDSTFILGKYPRKLFIQINDSIALDGITGAQVLDDSTAIVQQNNRFGIWSNHQWLIPAEMIQIKPYYDYLIGGKDGQNYLIHPYNSENKLVPIDDYKTMNRRIFFYTRDGKSGVSFMDIPDKKLYEIIIPTYSNSGHNWADRAVFYDNEQWGVLIKYGTEIHFEDVLNQLYDH